MRQSAERLAQRRSDAQHRGTFTFWFRRPNAARPVGAWMLERSASEAAFLTAAAEAPRVGERLELAQFDQAGITMAGHRQQPRSCLPKFGRVVRLDDPQGVTQRVAIRFENQTDASPAALDR